MSCLDGDCGGWNPPIITPEIPIKGGWALYGLPDGAPERLASHYRNHKFNGSNHEQVLKNIIKVLRANSVDLRIEDIRKWATEQWLARDPNRSKYGKGVVPDIPNFRDEAKKFWEGWNRRFSDIDSNVPLLIEAFVADAKSFISSPKFGCPDVCAKNLPAHLEAFPPENVHTILHAQVWLWKIHNLTREGLSPTDYGSVARKFKWPVMANAQARAYTEELRAK